MATIPLHGHAYAGNEERYVLSVLRSKALSADGEMTAQCQEWFLKEHGAKSLLTHSCTAALEMAALLLDIKCNDEVILPSFTHPSTANAFVLRGARLVFVDIDPDTLTLSLDRVAAAVTPRTRVVVPVHYAGISCDMDVLCRLAEREGIAIVEDAAHAMNARYKERALGTMGTFGFFSFHETKNVSSGEGGMLSVNDVSLFERALHIRDMGTNRSQFVSGNVDRYCWVDYGSSYGPSELTAAVLLAQLEQVKEITVARKRVCEYYNSILQPLADEALLSVPVVPSFAKSNGHQFHIMLANEEIRDGLLEHLRSAGIHAASHFIPLHCSPMGQAMGYVQGDLPMTVRASKCIVRLPCFAGLEEQKQDYIVQSIMSFFSLSPDRKSIAGEVIEKTLSLR